MPAETPVTIPPLVIVATPVVADVQAVVACAVAVPVNVLVEPVQTLKVPEMVGKAFTVIVAVVVHPFVF